MSTYETASKAFNIALGDPVKDALAAGKNGKGLGKVNDVAGSILASTVKAPLRLAGWTGSAIMKKVLSIFGTTAGYGLKALCLVPFPVPGGSIAALRGKISAADQAFNESARGSPLTLAQLYDKIMETRVVAAKRAERSGGTMRPDGAKTTETPAGMAA